MTRPRLRHRRRTIAWRTRAGRLYCPDFREPRDYWGFLAADHAAALAADSEGA